MGVTVRRLSAAQVEARAQALLSLLDRALRDSPLSSHRAADLEHVRGRIEDASIHPSQQVVVAEPGNTATPVGFALGLRGVPSPAGRNEADRRGSPEHTLFILWVAVATVHRRRGLATALLTSLVDDGDIRRAWLLVDDANLPARQLYRHLGWQQTTRQGSRRVLEMQINGPCEATRPGCR